MHPSHILLRSSWQSVNIGDIGHTPGLLSLLGKHLPDARVTLWPCEIENGVREMLMQAFPNVAIAEGTLQDGAPSTPELQAAWQDATFFLHGSGSGVVRSDDMAQWAKTGKPYGVFGVTIQTIDANLDALLSGARFVFTRETTSLQNLRAANVHCPLMEFAPDATFAIHLRDDAAGDEYLKRAGLESETFIAAVPRLRYTPTYLIHGREPHAEDLRRKKISDEFVAIDHQKLARALEIVTRETASRVLACPEMTYQVPLAKSLLIDPQPDDIKDRFVWRDSYWRPDEAASIYARAAAVVSFEMHSPIIAASVGVPAIYLRQPTDTIKGQMWRDIGLDEWIFEIDESDAEQIAARLLETIGDHAAAQMKLQRAMSFVKQRQAEATRAIWDVLT